MTERENMLRTIRFERPDHIPMVFAINPACYESYHHDDLFDLIADHKLLFPNFKRPEGKFTPEFAPVANASAPYTDDFGCVWKTTQNGITGTVVSHPLADWDSFASYKMPDPARSNGLEPIDWSQIEQEFVRVKQEGGFTQGGLRHGHTFLQLCDLRGYENLLFDMMDEEPLLDTLIEQLEAFNTEILKRYLAFDPDMVCFPEDLGMQSGPMLSPEQFVRYIKPSYQRMMKLARDKGKIVHMHSDGDIRLLVDELIDGGVDVINLQDLVNGVDWIAERFKGRVCIDLDIDRQSVTPYGTPEDIDRLIRTEVETLSSKDGGLMMIYGLYPGVPIENVKALMDAMERYMGL